MTPPIYRLISHSCVPEQLRKLKLLSGHIYMRALSPVLCSPGGNCWKKDDFSKQRHTSTLLKVIYIYILWELLSGFSSHYWEAHVSSIRFIMPAVRPQSIELWKSLLCVILWSTAGLKAPQELCFQPVLPWWEGRAKGVQYVFESICGYTENTRKHTNCHLFTWVCSIMGEEEAQGERFRLRLSLGKAGYRTGGESAEKKKNKAGQGTGLERRGM